jgi:hypothetical protein
MSDSARFVRRFEAPDESAVIGVWYRSLTGCSLTLLNGGRDGELASSRSPRNSLRAGWNFIHIKRTMRLVRSMRSRVSLRPGLA